MVERRVMEKRKLPEPLSNSMLGRYLFGGSHQPIERGIHMAKNVTKKAEEVVEETGDLVTLADNAGGLIRWVTDEGIEAIVPDSNYFKRVGGQFNQPAFYLRACDPDTNMAFFLKLTQGAATKLGMEWKKKAGRAVFGFVQVTKANGQIRYRVSVLKDLTNDEYNVAVKAIDEAALTEEALDETIASIG